MSSILMWLGATGLFIFGMKVMSDGLQKFAGPWLRNLLKTLPTSNRFKGIAIGGIISSAIQSSQATTIMVVSYVNAGLITLTEAISVVMGVNIGATLSAWIIAWVGFGLNTYFVASLFLGLAFPFLFSNRERVKNFASFMVGTGLLFLGLSLLKSSLALPGIERLLGAVTHLFVPSGIGAILLFVLLGNTLSLIIPSFGVVMSITMVLLHLHWISLPYAAAMVLGENMGATFSAMIAARVGNFPAKRIALFHSLFNGLSILWAVPLLWCLPPQTERFFIDLGISLPIALALFTTAFALTNTVFVIGLIPVVEVVLVQLVPQNGEQDEEHHLTYISTGLMSTPELSLAEAKKELQVFCKVIDKMSYGFSTLLFERDKDTDMLIEKMRKCEDLTDQIELELVNYLTKVSKSEMTIQATEKIREMLSMANDLERIADIYFMMTKNYQRMIKENVRLPQDAIEELRGMLDMVYRAIKYMRRNVELEPNEVNLKEVYHIQNEVKDTRRQLVKAHYERLEKNIYPSITGIIYLDYVVRAERIVSHIVNVNEASAGVR